MGIDLKACYYPHFPILAVSAINNFCFQRTKVSKNLELLHKKVFFLT